MTDGKKNLEPGDLVTHLLYGECWIGIILSFKEEIISISNRRNTKALVQIQPGTEYEGFFKRCSESDRVNDNLGYVSVHWLFKIKEKNANFRSSRCNTPSSGRKGKKLS
tara:strand:+ start:166 stop:492 length:327 start_codon:yes stop_codon:yes gene_type:complete